MADRIEIPDHCFQPKQLFHDHPGREIVEEVREWVKHNPPYLWRGHTHSKPSLEESGQIRYVNDFQLPKGVESPCPCCTPHHPKFGRGYIAWFPLTNSIRLMGQDCFRTLNPEGHDFAVQELDERIKRENEQNLLLNNLGKIPALIAALREAELIAEYLDDLRDILGVRLEGLTGIRLWPMVRSGALDIVVETSEGPVYERYASVSGSNLLDPARRRFKLAITSTIQIIQQIPLPFDPIKASDADRKMAARLLQRGLNSTRETLARMSEARLFVSILNTATMRNWAQLENAAARLYIRRDDLKLHIGINEREAHTIPLNPVIDKAIPRMP